MGATQMIVKTGGIINTVMIVIALDSVAWTRFETHLDH